MGLKASHICQLPIATLECSLVKGSLGLTVPEISALASFAVCAAQFIVVGDACSLHSWGAEENRAEGPRYLFKDMTSEAAH